MAAGYRRWAKPGLTHADFLYQKRVVSESGVTRYFVNFYEYLPTPQHDLGYQASIQGELPGGRSVTVECGSWVKSESLAEVERFFENAFTRLGFENYER